MLRKRGVFQIGNLTFLILVDVLSALNEVDTSTSLSTTGTANNSASYTTTAETASSSASSPPVQPTTTLTNITTINLTTSLSTSSTTPATSGSKSGLTTISTPKKSTTNFTETSAGDSSMNTAKSSIITASKTHLRESSGASSNSSDLSTQAMLTTSNPGKSPEFTQGMMLGVVLVVVALIVIGGFTLVHLKRRRKKSYKPFTKKSCLDCFKFTRLRSSSTTSHGPLTQDDSASIDIPAANQDRELFSIGDQDGGNDGRPSFSRPDGDDDYFYDEIFEQSAFQDRTTRDSNKHLTLSQDDDFDNFDDDELQVPDLTFRKPTSRI